MDAGNKTRQRAAEKRIGRVFCELSWISRSGKWLIPLMAKIPSGAKNDFQCSKNDFLNTLLD
jgi:hypothetical protein